MSERSIYIIANDVGMCKVGVALDPKIRLAGLQIGSSHPLRIAYSIVHDNAFCIERRAHKLLSGYRVQGEWFKCDSSIAEDAINRSTQFEIVSRSEAKIRGLIRFFTGDPCPRGHVCERRVANGNCIRCENISSSKNSRKRRNEQSVSPVMTLPMVPPVIHPVMSTVAGSTSQEIAVMPPVCKAVQNEAKNNRSTVRESAIISQHQIQVCDFAIRAKGWFTSKDVTRKTKLATRTVQLHLTRLATLGVLERLIVFGGDRYRIMPNLDESAIDYISRLERAKKTLEKRSAIGSMFDALRGALPAM